MAMTPFLPLRIDGGALDFYHGDLCGVDIDIFGVNERKFIEIDGHSGIPPAQVISTVIIGLGREARHLPLQEFIDIQAMCDEVVLQPSKIIYSFPLNRPPEYSSLNLSTSFFGRPVTMTSGRRPAPLEDRSSSK